MEMLIGGGLAAFTIYAATKWHKSDRDKIQHTFRNIKYTVDKKEPRLIKTHKADKSTLYTYSVPFGLVDDEKLQVLERVLNRPVRISFINQKLHIRVYKHQLPTKISYDWQPTSEWTAPIGQSQEQFIWHDFDKIPHMTIAGMTRQGKTVLLKLIFAHLIQSHPNNVEFHIIDLKGGLEFAPYENLQQVKTVASDVHEAQDLLETIQEEIRDDMSHFKANGYRNIVNTPIKRRRFIIVDEGAELTPSPHHSKDEKKEYQYCQYALSEIARVAGALGYRLIFATQYPTTDTLPRQIKQNADAKISFRLPTEVASRVAIDEQGAERIGNVGRAIYRTHEKHVLQVPFVEDEEIENKLKEWEHVSPTREASAERGTDTITFG